MAHYSYSALCHSIWRQGQKRTEVSVFYDTRLKGGSVSVETVCRCQMSYRWVMVTSGRAMGNFQRLEGRQREDCLLTKRVIERGSVCVCVCVFIFPQDLDALLSLNSRHLCYLTDPSISYLQSYCVFVVLCTWIVVDVSMWTWMLFITYFAFHSHAVLGKLGLGNMVKNTKHYSSFYPNLI